MLLMALRAPDIKDEYGWQILTENDAVVAHAPSRDKARAYAHDSSSVDIDGFIFNGQVLPPDDSPEAVAARHAWDVHQKLRRATLAMNMAWVAQATYLYDIYANRLWEDLNFESFDAYLADPDTDINQRWGYNLVAIYKQLVIDRGVETDRLKLLDVSKVTEALPAIRREQIGIDEALADIQALSKSALKLKLSGRASSTPGVPDTKVKIETDREPQYGICDVCGSRARIDPETGAWLK